MIDIKDLRKSCDENRVTITQHATLRLLERGITMSDIVTVIKTGEIIRQYEDDKPFSKLSRSWTRRHRTCNPHSCKSRWSYNVRNYRLLSRPKYLARKF